MLDYTYMLPGPRQAEASYVMYLAKRKPLSAQRFLTFNFTTKCLHSLCNSILRASIEKGSPQLALLHYNTLLLSAAIRPDHRTLSLVLKACTHSANIDAATAVHARIAKTGFQSHSSLATTLFYLYINHQKLDDAHHLFEEMLDCDTSPNPVYGNLMLNRLLRSKQFQKASRVFKVLPDRDLVTWNTMIAGCVKNSRPIEGISLFRRMIHSGFEPDAFTFSAALSACAHIGALGHGEWVHRLMTQKGVEFKFNHILASAMVDMYAKCGRIEDAQRVFDSISRDQVSVWNSMITGLAIHGLGHDVIDVFSMMEREGVSPDGITFLGVLTACSHCGMVEDTRCYFKAMGSKYSVEPSIEHYGAMVDCLARAGQLEEACELIRAMPVEPDDTMWRALLSACRRHRRAELAEEVVQRMAQCGSGDYVVMSSIYASTSRWHSAERVWGVMRERGVRKSRGLSWVEHGSMVQQFKAGDRSQPEVVQMVEGITRRLKAEGFEPMTEVVGVDVMEEEREENLGGHSEKLAVGYSVLMTAPGAEIRVSKNLRTCGDCHEWMKMVSKVLSRVIVMRDRLRFHRFERGSCSCKDYW